MPTRHGRIVRKRGSEPSLGVSSDGNNLETREGLFFCSLRFLFTGFFQSMTRGTAKPFKIKSEFAANILDRFKWVCYAVDHTPEDGSDAH